MLLAQIASLQAQIATLTVNASQSLNVPASTSASSPACPSLFRNLSRNSRGEDVRGLQWFLVAEGVLTSESTTGLYGKWTEIAVQDWQKKKGIVSSGAPESTGFGAVGLRTRAAIGLVCANPTKPLSATAINVLARIRAAIVGTPIAALTMFGPDSDFLDGGEGVDTVSFSGPRSQYAIYQKPDDYAKDYLLALLIHDLKDNSVDLIVNTEYIQFADQKLYVPSFTFTSSAPASSQLAAATGTHNLAEIEQWRASGASRKCILTTNRETQTLYVSFGMTLASTEYKGSENHYFALVRDGVMYGWDTKDMSGLKLPFTSTAPSFSSEKTYTCTEWSPDSSVFVIPTNITFTDLASSEGLEKARLEGRDARRISDVKQLQLALELYYDKTGIYPASLSSLTSAMPTGSGYSSYISSVPVDPSDSMAYPYDQLNNGSAYELGANLENSTHGQLQYDVDTANPGGTLTSAVDASSCTGAAGRYCYAVAP